MFVRVVDVLEPVRVDGDGGELHRRLQGTASQLTGQREGTTRPIHKIGKYRKHTVPVLSKLKK